MLYFFGFISRDEKISHCSHFWALFGPLMVPKTFVEMFFYINICSAPVKFNFTSIEKDRVNTVELIHFLTFWTPKAGPLVHCGAYKLVS